MPRQPSAQTRDHVLEVAADLFYWNGIRATGVDKIAAEAGIAPTTLYRLFASKDDLVTAYVQRADRAYRTWFDTAAATGATPRDAILAVFDALTVQTHPDVCRGCTFQMALAEIPDSQAPAHQAAVEMKSWVHSRLHTLTGDETTADHLMLIMEGVYGSIQSLGADGPARRARALVATILPA